MSKTDTISELPVYGRSTCLVRVDLCSLWNKRLLNAKEAPIIGSNKTRQGSALPSTLKPAGYFFVGRAL